MPRMEHLGNGPSGMRPYWANLSETAKTTIAAAVCFCFFLCIYGFTSHAEASASDEIAAFRTGVVLATRHSLAIDDIKSVQKVTFIGTWGRGDHLYSRYFPGTVLTTAFLYSIAAKPDDAPYFAPNPTYGHVLLADSARGARVALMVNAVLGAAGMTMLFLMLASLFGMRTAVITTLIMGLGTDWWYESQLFYLEIGAGAFLIASLYFAHMERPYLSGLALAASLLFRPTNILGLPVWGLAVWKTKLRMLGSAIFLVGAVVFLGLYNYARFRSYFDFGYAGAGFTNSVQVGVVGLFLSPGHSFLLYSPITLLAGFGAYWMWKGNRALTLACLLTITGYIFMAATWESWSGGKVWGSRLIIPVLPLLGVLVGAVIAKVIASPTRGWISAVVALTVLGFAMQMILVFQDPAIAIRYYTQNGFATVTDTTWSVTRNWLVLEIMSLRNWNICNTGAYSLRMLLAQCGQVVVSK
jgi:hypothetical protein